jgi:hypothetical protein
MGGIREEAGDGIHQFYDGCQEKDHVALSEDGEPRQRREWRGRGRGEGRAGELAMYTEEGPNAESTMVSHLLHGCPPEAEICARPEPVDSLHGAVSCLAGGLEGIWGCCDSNMEAWAAHAWAQEGAYRGRAAAWTHGADVHEHKREPGSLEWPQGDCA